LPNKLTLAALLVGLALFGQACAGPLEQARTAYEQRDYATALRLFRPLADQGNAVAQNGLGIMYSNGDGVPRDASEAAKWYRLAAEQGNTVAQYSLAYLYVTGQGVPEDYVQAHKWYDLAITSAMSVRANSSNDQQGLGLLIGYRDALAAKMTPAQIAEAEMLAREWKPKQ